MKTSEEINAKHAKLFISLRYWLLGMAQSDPRYFKAVEALDYAAKFHTNKRKDGITPEFYHQLNIVHYIRTIHKMLINPLEAIITAILHDTSEDYDLSYDEITRLFGERVSKSVELMTKKFRDISKPTDAYYNAMANCPIASIDKLADRMHNLQSMVNVFTIQKIKDYLIETETYVLPMLKKAKRNFPEQELAYENAKLIIVSQIELINATLTARKA
jgi:(p)ppGpp synthase/HD superfamily hydrolase